MLSLITRTQNPQNPITVDVALTGLMINALLIYGIWHWL